ncbi:hypothetical protein GpartN1_g5455.t1 [Galdieria partita]|uniref:dolichyl-P-Man:Man5GlcNAc2-PP-dolichol alpha-1,3-mannosyltransferase n=1 Tax=Galdieria partita TaxID=83374 RepID=A0A9C7PZY2_9RHOD|nr:hypothetical protein GpartN1_g5455.t1 [Galdieria partita]
MKWKFSILFCLFDFLVGVGVIYYVPFTEIDFQTYLQQVYQVFREGKRDYSQIRGDSGPLVYPGGFLFIYRLFYAMSNGGSDLLPVQICFALIHSATLCTVCAICIYCQLDTKEFLFCSVPLLFSRRVMSIHVLRLFNDAIVTFLSYLSILFFVAQRHFVACIVYSLSVSVKMSALLYAPAVLMVLLETTGYKQAVSYILVCGAVQFLVGLPFLYHHPISYISKAFEFHRVFLYEWTVNWKFLPEHIFKHPLWSLVLLLSHIAMLELWYKRVVRKMFENFRKLCQEKSKQRNVILGRGIVTALFQCQFIGIAFARSIHYQFYTWYFHSLPWILYSLGISLQQSCFLLFVIELVYNMYPPTWYMSILLQYCHLYIIYKILQSGSDQRITQCLVQSIKTKSAEE